jgi:hypothetical protein
VNGPLAHLSYDPSLTGTPRYPLDSAFQTAAQRRLLTQVQVSRLADLDRVLARRARSLVWEWDSFRRAPYVLALRRRLLDALHGFYDPRPAFERAELEPPRFFDREQRESLRALGHRIPGRCFMDLSGAKAALELRSCPLGQLSETWNRLVADGGVGALQVRVRAGAEAREVESVSFSADHLPAGEAARVLLGIVTSFDGVIRARPTPAARP